MLRWRNASTIDLLRARIRAGGGCGLLGYALILIFAPFFAAMSWAAFLAFLLYPLNLRLRRRFAASRAPRAC